MVNVEVSEFVKAKLEELKEKEGHKSLDSVIRVLLLRREGDALIKEKELD